MFFPLTSQKTYVLIDPRTNKATFQRHVSVAWAGRLSNFCIDRWEYVPLDQHRKGGGGGGFWKSEGYKTYPSLPNTSWGSVFDR